MALEDSLQIKQGDDWAKVLTFTDSAGSAINLTGYTVGFIAKKRKSDADAAAVINESSVTVTDAAAGQATVILTDTETAAIPAGLYYYQARLLDGSGEYEQSREGILNVIKTIFD